MHETVWLGRGGQGAFTAARLLGIAAMLSGQQAMAMPAFGPERRGAPVFAYTRIDAAKVRDRSAVRQADVAVILDETLLTQVPTSFLTPKTLLIIDSEKENTTPDSLVAGRIIRIPARRIAREIMGSEHTNSVLFGALVGLTGIVSQSAAEEGIRRELGTGSKGVKNLAAFQHAFSIGLEGLEKGVAHG
ncbi:MAG: 2-oxoacid:acceptor oxidoreductase family protein [Betaproteobacteria bacterium]